MTTPQLKKKTFICLTTVTVLYSLLFPLLLWSSLFSLMVFDSPDIRAWQGWTLVGLFFLIPLSIPLALYLMWSSYRKELYKPSLWSCLLPPVTFTFVFLLIYLLGFLWN